MRRCDRLPFMGPTGPFVTSIKLTSRGAGASAHAPWNAGAGLSRAPITSRSADAWCTRSTTSRRSRPPVGVSSWSPASQIARNENRRPCSAPGSAVIPYQISAGAHRKEDRRMSIRTPTSPKRKRATQRASSRRCALRWHGPRFTRGRRSRRLTTVWILRPRAIASEVSS